ncbi:MAG: rod shape-determining protein MreD [Bacteroidales bacterium]|nr:rod shape-determining protein MreD [Bacteroidales bacterium]
MMNNTLLNIVRFSILMLLQTLVLNNIYLGGYITPFLYILCILMLPTSTPRLAMLLIAFSAGLLQDVSCNMLGFHAFAATFVAFLRILFADKILTRGEDIEIDVPSIRSVPIAPMLYYLIILILAYYIVYYSLLFFSWRDILQIGISSVAGSALTWVLAVLYQTLFIRRTT